MLGELQNDSADSATPIGEVLIRLATNHVDRGVITITCEGEGTAKISVCIGTGPNHAPNATPPSVVEFSRDGVETRGANTPFSAALAALVSVGKWMLDVLEEAA